MNITLDLARRGLQQHLRAPGWILARAALTVLLIVALAVAGGAAARLGAPGRSFFLALLIVDLVFLTAIAIGPFASALAEEKEGDTLNVLRLAGLTSPAIVSAKALGLLASTLLLLVLEVPFAMLATTLGGVSARQVAATFVVLLSYTLAAQGIALACAARAPNTKAASYRTGWILSAWLLLPTVLATLVSMVGGWTRGAGPQPVGPGPAPPIAIDVIDLLHLASPLSAALAAAREPAPPLFPFAVWLSLALAPLGFAIAVWALADTPAKARPAAPPRIRRLRPVGLRTKALIWKEQNFLLGGPVAMRRRLMWYWVLFFALGVLTFDPRGGWFASWGTVGVWTFLLAGLIEAGIAASHLYRDEIRERTLFGLALLPVPPMTWAMAKARGGLRAVRAPSWALAASCACVVFSRPVAMVALPVAVLAWVMLGLLIVNLTLYLSLWLPRGSFPAAAATVLIPSGLLLSSGAFEVACCFFYVGPIAILSVLGWLQVAIGRRLRLLATRS